MENLNKHRDKINHSLKKFLQNKLDHDGKISPDIKNLIGNILEFNLRSAKRIRPLITIFSYKCFKDDDKIILPSLSIELMQAYLLIHDDIMDKSDLRRGKPSVHKIYEKNKDEHYGLSIAILAGDLCSGYMYDSILESEFSESEKTKAVEYLAWTNKREGYGQFLDMLPGFKNLTEEDVFKIYELKTATYTVQAPIYLGATLANAPEEKIQQLQKYAYNIGIAFQIQDDINSVFGNKEKIGKPNDSDIKEGKKSLLIAKTLELCNEEDKKFILENYGNENINLENIEKIRQIMKSCKSYNYCKNKLNELVKEGKKSISDLELREEGKRFLIDIADYILELAN